MEGKVEKGIWRGISNAKDHLKKLYGNLLLQHLLKYIHIYVHLVFIHICKKFKWS